MLRFFSFFFLLIAPLIIQSGAFADSFDRDIEELLEKTGNIEGHLTPEQARKRAIEMAEKLGFDQSESKSLSLDELEQELKDFEFDQKKILKAFEKLKSPKQSSNGADLDAMIDLGLGQFQKMSGKEVENLILKKSEGNSFFHDQLKENPKILTFLVNMLRDKEAFKNLVKITSTKPRIYYYGGCMLATIILGWILKWWMQKKMGTGFSVSLKRFFIIFSTRLGITLFFFHKELAPTWRVFTKSFLN